MLNMDFTKNLVIETEPMDWEPSPLSGVNRKRLAYEEIEQGHATSIVEFQAGAHFRPHDHPLGEEILVLDGVFSDDSGAFKAGCYFRNPEGFIHAPFSRDGCLLFVKLYQFQPEDTQRVMIDTKTTEWLPGQGNLEVMPLHEFAGEHTALVKWPAGERFVYHQHWGGEEIFVLSGTFIDEHGRYPAGTWLRSAHLSKHHPFVEEETVIYVKTGHLPF